MKPKFSLTAKKRKFVASKEFTDREEPRDLFNDAVNELFRTGKVRENRVIVYYGVGGIGKTSLQKQLKTELQDKYPNAVYSSLDFKDDNLHRCSRALLEMSKNMKSVEKVKFPHFEIAYAIYFMKRNPDITFNKKSLPFEDEIGIFSTIASLVDGAGILGVTSNILSKLYDSAKWFGLDPDVKDSYLKLEELTALEIEERLPAYFCYDLNYHLAKYKTKNSVIFLDTYEAFVKDALNNNSYYEKTAWIRDIVDELDNTLFVICSREMVKWGEYDKRWDDILDHHIIGNLNEKYTTSFLNQCGIEDEQIVDIIFKSSEGHPYYLDLSVDTFVSIKNNDEEPTIYKFGKTKKEILDRFLKYLTEQEKEALKVMCVPRSYDKDLFIDLLKYFNTGYSPSKFNEFNNFSFVTKDNYIYTIHLLMRESMYEYTDSDYRDDIHLYLMNKYNQKIMHRDQVEDKILYFKEYLYHVQKAFKGEELGNYLVKNSLSLLKQFQMYGEANYLLSTLRAVLKDVNIKHMHISLIEIMVDIIHLNGNYEEAVELIRDYLTQFSETEILATPTLVKLYIRKAHHEMFFKPVKAIIDDLKTFESKIINPEIMPSEYNELLFMIGGNLGVLYGGDLKLCRKYLVKSIRFSQKHNLVDYYVRSVRKYADILRVKGHFKWAQQLVTEGIQLCKHQRYERYGLYLQCTLADILRVNKRFEEAEKLYHTVLNKAKLLKIRGWWAHAYLGGAELEYDRGKYEKALIDYEFALQMYLKIGQKWGIAQAKLGILKCNKKGFVKTEIVNRSDIETELLTYNYMRELKWLHSNFNKPYQLMYL
jgi:hypothetical protein